jgi:hypothetical protein
MTSFNDALASIKLPSDVSKNPPPVTPVTPPVFRVGKPPENPPPKPPCFRCGGDGEISLVGRGRKGGNAGGVVEIRCPVCKGTGK